MSWLTGCSEIKTNSNDKFAENKQASLVNLNIAELPQLEWFFLSTWTVFAIRNVPIRRFNICYYYIYHMYNFFRQFVLFN